MMDGDKDSLHSCTNCHRNLGIWDFHLLCRRCRLCSKATRCTVCLHWPESNWKKIAKSLTEATIRSRESDSRSSSHKRRGRGSHSTKSDPQSTTTPQHKTSGSSRHKDDSSRQGRTKPARSTHSSVPHASQKVVTVAEVHKAPPVVAAAPPVLPDKAGDHVAIQGPLQTTSASPQQHDQPHAAAPTPSTIVGQS